MTYIIWPQMAGHEADLGGKARGLAHLRRARMPIPDWIVLTPSAFSDSLTFAQRQAFESGDARAVATVLRAEIRLDHDVMVDLERALAELCPDGHPVAVRSSASEEDGDSQSFAGQYDSFLFVPSTAPAIAERAADVWRSAFGAKALAYRELHGITGMPHPPSVLIQRMVNADRSGVAFGADPVSGRRGIAVIAAVWGLGSSLVSGECDADSYHVDRTGAVVWREIANKRVAHCPAPESPEGIESIPVPESESRRPVLSDDQVRAIADLVRRAGCHSETPRDIEWAIEEGRLYLLQSRPITGIAAIRDPDGALNIWDNSNIAESYSGITTPLTFSFARRAYTEVYRALCRTLGVSNRTIAANGEIFRHMLGLIKGRVYYNLLNWYRLLALLPGFASNRTFMEQMMGVRERLPDEMAAEIAVAGADNLTVDRLQMAATFVGMGLNYLQLPLSIRRFHDRLNSALELSAQPLEAMRADELAALYGTMERRLLTRWDAPLVNDLFAMMFYGLLGRLTNQWSGDTDGTLRNALVGGAGGMISAEPARRVREMAAALTGDLEMIELMRSGTPEEVHAAVEQRPAFSAKYFSYLYEFGDRCMEELKLESPTLHDDPTTLNRAIGRLAIEKPVSNAGQESPAESEKPWETGNRRAGGSTTEGTADRERSENAAFAAGRLAALPPLRRAVVKWLMKGARNRIRDRENLRFERTRLFGRVRRIFVEIGKRFAEDQILDDARDIFYLEVEDILGFIAGTSTSTNLRGLVALRQAEFDRYRAMEPPADRFSTRGPVYLRNPFEADAANSATAEGRSDQRTLSGLPCSAGIVRARVRVIRDPRDAEIQPGSILVAERTDPGWVLLFPAAAGLLVERGSLLSHSAIVAREMGIPAIVSIPGLMHILSDGDMVEMDGSTGTVRRLYELPTEGPPLQRLDTADSSPQSPLQPLQTSLPGAHISAAVEESAPTTPAVIESDKRETEAISAPPEPAANQNGALVETTDAKGSEFLPDIAPPILAVAAVRSNDHPDATPKQDVLDLVDEPEEIAAEAPGNAE